MPPPEGWENVKKGRINDKNTVEVIDFIVFSFEGLF
jgi:hypothetical protein